MASLLRLAERYARTDLAYFVSAGFWMNLMTVSVSLLSLLLYIVFAHVVPKETVGVYQYLLSLGLILSAFTLTGMNSAVTRAVARGHDGALREAVRFQTRWLVLPILATFLGSAYYFLKGDLGLAIGVGIVGVGTAVISVFNTYSAFLLGKEDFKRAFALNLGINLPFYGALIACAFLTDSPLILLGTYMIVQAVGYGVAYLATLRAYRPSDTAEPGMTTYGAHLSVTNVPNVIAQSLDIVLAFHFLGPVAVALYAYATAVPERVSGLFKFLPSAAMPRFATRSLEDVRETILWRLFLVALLLLASAGAYALIAPYLFAFLFPSYTDAVPYTQMYSLILLSILTQIVVSALSAQQRLKSLYFYGFASPATQAVLQIGGILLLGFWGLIIGKLLGMLASFFLALFFLFTDDAR